MEYKDYYQTLGLEKSAAADDIKKAYRKLVRKYHPDVSKETDAEHKTKELNEAYGVLGDPDKRAAYDQLGRQGAGQPFSPPPDWGASPDQTDLFADLFANLGAHRRGRFQARGDDSHASIVIDLADAYHGATRGISLRASHGAADQRGLDVRIPAGVTEGQRLRLAGQGQPGVGGAPSGDLYLEIRFKPDARYHIEGRDVQQTLPVAPWEAALGAQIELATPSGKVTVTVPAGSQGGRRLRLKGRGIPGDPPGDLYLRLEVVLPPADSAPARALYETMAREMAFDARQKMGV